MKMKLNLIHNPYGLESIEHFAFSEAANGSVQDIFDQVWSNAVDMDPLIEEQTIRIDLGTAKPMIDYAYAEYDPPEKQEMDKYPPVWFFYVTAVERKRSSTVCDVHIKLDGLTTLMYAQQAKLKPINDLFTNQSYIRREHRSRFLAPSNNYSQYAIDKVKEGIPVDLKKISRRVLVGNSQYENTLHWFLVYRSRQSWSGGDPSSGNAIDVYICPAKKLKVSSSQSSGTGSDVFWSSLGEMRFTMGNTYYVSTEWSPGFSMEVPTSTQAILRLSASNYFMIAITYGTDGKLYYDCFKGNPGMIEDIVSYELDLSAWTSAYRFRFIDLSEFRVLSRYSTNQEEIAEGSVLSIGAGTTSVSAVYSTKFSDLDRTDPLLVKIIESPYAPSILQRDSNLNFSLVNCDFDQATGMWKPRANTPWQQALTYDDSTLIKFSKETAKYVGAADYEDEWDGFDPKLLSSEFYEIKLVYDVYSVTIELENEDIPANRYTDVAGRRISAYWHISPEMNSVFLLHAGLSYLANAQLEAKTQDFGSYCVIDRNNEKPLFTNAYLNYMRVGYNYDQKAKSLQNWSALAGIVISAAGTVIGAATGQAVITAASAAGLIASISGAAFGAASRENSLQGKLAQLKAQGTSVAGSSDVSLLNIYCPFVQLIEYYPDPAIASSLATLFHRFGYATNQFKKPDVESRSLWNYLEGDVVIDEHQTQGIPPQVVARAIEQVKEGVTIFHATHDRYDLLQTCENWEEDVLQQ